MKKFFFFVFIVVQPLLLMAQSREEAADTSWKNIYRESHTRINDLVHTRLDVRFDYNRSWMYGKEWLTLQPHFYPTDSLVLDAKGMEIKELSVMNGAVKTPLKYTYDGLQLYVQLNRTYKAGEKYTLYIDYISKPNELKTKGSAAITDAKGLYFINPTGEIEGKPTQIWTQGETEASSVWFVTIDKPNQKTTQEISMTVPAKYVSLSNGLLTSQKKNADGTRTDTWKMALPHAPYLFFMGVGDFAIIKDNYKGKEVSYYVEKDQAPYARNVFGNTPEMMKFFSDKLQIDYPWVKYSQMVGRDYVSGAMENTTATLHQESAYQNNRQLADGNAWEETIAHELFHQWFGDLVTAESWGQLTVNESFANYSEYLWDEYKYGKDFADAHHYQDMQVYLNSGSDKKELVRRHFADKEEVFDAVSYHKGGRILHMLRNYVGDAAFYKSLNNYLTVNKFKTGEAAQLRLAFEEVTGKDLNWFWDQWYYNSGHPKLKIHYNYDVPGKSMVIVEQTQTAKPFKLPVAIDIYTGTSKARHNVWLSQKIDTLVFNSPVKPDLINVDADKYLLAEKTDNKSEANFIVQWNNAKNYLDRREALDFFAKKNMPEIAKGLNDRFANLRSHTIQKLSTTAYKSDPVVLSTIEDLAKTDRNKIAKSNAIKFLAKTADAKYLPIYQAAVYDSSYTVAAAALNGIAGVDKQQAFTLAKKLSSDAKGPLGNAVSDILIASGTEADFDFIAKKYDEAPLSFEKITMTSKFAEYLSRINDMSKVKKGIDHIIKFRNMIPEAFRPQVDPSFTSALAKISKAKGEEIENYIQKVFK